MAISSAGLLLYRKIKGRLEVLLVHPGGPFWAKKDEGSWTIPKGEISENEVPLQAAIREVKEETGFDASKYLLIELSPIKQKSGKKVFAWAVEADIDSAAIKSNLFEMEWPPKSGGKKNFPEIDRASWFTPQQAYEKILPAQIPFIEELEKKYKK